MRMIKASRMGLTGHVSRIGEKKNEQRGLAGTPEGKRPLGRQRRRFVDNIKMNLSEIAWDDMDWIDPLQDRDQLRALVNMAMNLLFHRILGNSSLGTQLAASEEVISSMSE
jgi:hypothetical protein